MTLQKPNPQITKIKGQSRGHWPPRPSCHASLEWFYGRIKHSRDSTVKDRRSKKVRLIAYIEFSRRARVYRTGIREIRLIPVVPFQLSVACTVAVYNSSWSNGLSTVITPCNTHTHTHTVTHSNRPQTQYHHFRPPNITENPPVGALMFTLCAKLRRMQCTLL